MNININYPNKISNINTIEIVPSKKLESDKENNNFYSGLRKNIKKYEKELLNKKVELENYKKKLGDKKLLSSFEDWQLRTLQYDHNVLEGTVARLKMRLKRGY